MKKVLIGIGITLVLIVVVGFIFRTPLFMAFMGSQISPDHDFSADRVPTAPNYQDDPAWAALPSVNDPSDQMPDGVTSAPTGVAVFFVHPTSFISKKGWNQELDDPSANWLVDERILRHQATVFNSCCDIYAPRYRQATFYSFFDDTDNGSQALALAYNDVVDAFDEFLLRIEPNQAFIVAGHSQGTKHATQLVAEKVAGTDLMQRMVAAYLVGFSVTHEQLGEIPACTSATQTGCALGWNAMDGEGEGAFSGSGNLLCTNPLTWLRDDVYAGHELNTGAIGYPTYGAAEDGEDITQMEVETGIADAQCFNGQLAVQDLRSTSFPARMLGNSMHVYDYSLYHMNIRANVAQRIAAFQANLTGL